MEEQQTKSIVSVPVAIVIAGALVALAVYFSRGTPTNTTQTQENAVEQTAAVASAITIRQISDADHVLGNPAAPIAAVVYTDTECPFCKFFHATMHQVVETYGKNGSVLWVFRHFPLVQLHPRAQKESEAAECAAELGGKTAFWDFMDEIFKVTPSNNGLDPEELPKIAVRLGLNEKAFSNCLASGKYESAVASDYEEAIRAGGFGTPFTVFVSKKTLSEQTVQIIQSINKEFETQNPSGTPPFTISTDKRRVSMSGALPFVYLQRVIDALLGG